MSWAAWAQAILTFGGILLVWRTLKHTKDAAVAAKVAAKAAAETLEVAELNIGQQEYVSEMQLRPYLLVHDITMVREPTEHQTPKFEVRVKNYGQTPAIDVIQRVGFQTVSDDEKPVANFNGFSPPKQTIGQGQIIIIEVGLLRQRLEKVLMFAISKLQLRCSGFGYISYKGINGGKTYRTIFRFELKLIEGLGWRIVPTKKNNRVS